MRLQSRGMSNRFCNIGARFLLLASIYSLAYASRSPPSTWNPVSALADSGTRKLQASGDLTDDELYAKLLKFRRSEEVERLIKVYEEVGRELASEWRFDQQVLCMSATVHGRMFKRAYGSELPWQLWTIERRLGHMKSRPTWKPVPRSVPIFGSEGYISKKYKFIYIRSQKSSSSTILKALTDTFCGSTGVCTQDELTTWNVIPSNTIWREYFVFTWVRNPWQRIASSYSFLSQHLRIRVPGREEPGPTCSIPMRTFSEYSHSMVDMCDERDCCPYYTYPTARWDYDFIPGHLSDQAGVTFASDGRSFVDFIGRTEHIEEDWKTLLECFYERTGARFKNVELQNINAVGATAHSAEELCRKHMNILNETTVWLLTKQYAMDVYRFGFRVKPQPL